MSDSNDVPAAPVPAAKSMPVWFIAGILGVFIGGAGGMLLAIYGYDYRMKKIKAHAAASTAPGMPGPGAGMAPPGMGMGAPGMGPPGMGGGPNAKRELTRFVGKIELLSRPNIRLELDAEQQAKLGAELAALEQAEALTDEDAEKRLEALEALLAPEQKETLDAISLPRRGRGGGGPMGGPAESPDENPFAQEANQKRLHDLLSRLQSAAENKPAETP